MLLFYCDEVMKRSSCPPFIARITGKMSNFLKSASVLGFKNFYREFNVGSRDR